MGLERGSQSPGGGVPSGGLGSRRGGAGKPLGGLYRLGEADAMAWRDEKSPEKVPTLNPPRHEVLGARC